MKRLLLGLMLAALSLAAQAQQDLLGLALDPILAARFIQVDSQVSTLLDFELMKSTPLIAPPPETDVELVE
jgi:hypothetical protein